MTLDPYLVVEVKRAIGGDSWKKMLKDQLLDQCDAVKDISGRTWAIGQKGLEIYMFRFDVLKFEDDEPYTNFDPINLNDWKKSDFYSLGIKYETNEDDRITIIKWRLDDEDQVIFIHNMFTYLVDNG